MSRSAKWIGDPRRYPVLGCGWINEIEVRLMYQVDHPRGFYAVITPQLVDESSYGGIRKVSFDFLSVKKHYILSCDHYSPKAEALAAETVSVIEPLWIEKICKEYGLELRCENA